MKKAISIGLVSMWAPMIYAQTDADLNKLSTAETSQGFKLLFDGTLQSFKDNFQDYAQNDKSTNGNLSGQWDVDANLKAIILKANTTDIRSKTMYKDFDLRMDYRCDGNEGVFYRFTTQFGAAYESGVEFAIDNRTDPCEVCPGAAYDVFAPLKATYKIRSSNIWNKLRLVVQGDSVEHWLNDELILAYRYHSKAWWEGDGRKRGNGQPDGYNTSKWNGASAMSVANPPNRNSGPIKEGYVGLQANHGGHWEIRNFRLGSTNVTMGPIITTGSLKQSHSDKVAQSVVASKLASNGVVNLSFVGMKVQSAEVFDLGGKRVGSVSINQGGSSATAQGIKQAGMHFIKYTASNSTHIEKINLL